MTTSLGDDEISKRIFFAGLFGLPWLQLAHSMGFYADQRGNEVSTESGTPFMLLWLIHSWDHHIGIRPTPCTRWWLTHVLSCPFVLPCFYRSVSKPKDVGQPKPELCYFDDTALVHLDSLGSIHLSGKAAIVSVCTCSRSRRVHRLVKNSCQVPVVNVDACRTLDTTRWIVTRMSVWMVGVWYYLHWTTPARRIQVHTADGAWVVGLMFAYIRLYASNVSFRNHHMFTRWFL